MTAGASMRHAAPTPWSDAEREQLRRMRENGLSMSQMAQLLGRTKDSVSRQMRNLELAKNERAQGAVKSPNTHPKGQVGHPRARHSAAADTAEPDGRRT